MYVGHALRFVYSLRALPFQLCDVAEFGLVGKTMHKIDEHVEIDDIDRLAAIYCDMLVAARV